MTVRRIEVPIGHGFKPWMPQAITLTQYELKPTTIAISSPVADRGITEAHFYRVVDSGDDWLDITDDGAEADRLMAIAKNQVMAE